jgi:hypothetical protein
MNNSIQYIRIIKITIILLISIAAIFVINCSLLFPKTYSAIHRTDNSNYCQQAAEKSKECEGYSGQKQSECYEQLNNLQNKCIEDFKQ